MHVAAGTLGQVLYAKSGSAPVRESEWVELVRGIAAGDAEALVSLYDRTSDAVFTLFVRLTLDRELAEELALRVYSDVRGHAAQYSRSSSTVLAWIMRRARSHAIHALRAEHGKNVTESRAGLISIDMPDYRHIVRFREESARLAAALATLEAHERQAIEAVYFERQTSPSADLRSGMYKLARALNASQLHDESAQCPQADRTYAYALHALPPAEAAAVEAHRAACRWCRWELDSLRAVLNVFVAWPRDLLRPPRSLRERLMAQIGAAGPIAEWVAPGWEAVAPGISCKLLATDTERNRVSMLVRLVPGGEYPPHTHAGAEELHVLDGELWIDERKLYAGDYNRAEAGSSDQRVWSETGCACVLVTSTADVILNSGSGR